MSPLPPCGPLSLLFSRVAEDPADPPQVDFIYLMVDEISPANWARFCHYAALIREVRHDDVTDTCIGKSVFDYLSRKSGGRVPDLRFEILCESEAAWLGPDPETLHLSQLIESLSRLRNIEAFCLVIRDTEVVTDDSSFEAAAKAWPRLLLRVRRQCSYICEHALRARAFCPVLSFAAHALAYALGRRRRHPSWSGAAFTKRAEEVSFYLMEDMKIHDPEATG